MVEASRAAMRGSPAAPNPVFLLGAWGNLPGPLTAASLITVLFPWGSLLQAVATADGDLVERLTATAAPDASIEIVTAIEPATDRSELRRLGLDGFTREAMATAWREHGLAVEQTPLGPDHPYQTTWWRRIRRTPGRTATLTRVTLPGRALPVQRERQRSR
ncbi:MAG TPA: hypothetical protein PKI89_06950 [Tepidiformaceae bacterium]|nr:hypothetical protein [Tepidiformaceae bacterium]